MSKAMACWRSPTTQTTKTGLRCKRSKWGRVEEVGRANCCRGNAALKQDWLAFVSCFRFWVKRASQDEAGLLDKFIKSLTTWCRDAAAPAD